MILNWTVVLRAITSSLETAKTMRHLLRFLRFPLRQLRTSWSKFRIWSTWLRISKGRFIGTKTKRKSCIERLALWRAEWMKGFRRTRWRVLYKGGIYENGVLINLNGLLCTDFWYLHISVQFKCVFIKSLRLWSSKVSGAICRYYF